MAVLKGSITDDLPDAYAINFVTFARVGREVEMLAGFIDMKRLADYLDSRKGELGEDEVVERPVDFYGRFVMSAQTIASLKEKVDEMHEALQGEGALPDEDKD